MTSRIPACPNCKVRPVFVPSDDPEYGVLLRHDTTTCPNRIDIYHLTPGEAAAKWRETGALWPFRRNPASGVMG